MSEQPLDKVEHPKNNVVAYQESFSGPLPHPQLLSAYEKIHPGIADRIVKMAERQSEHRQTLEAAAVRSGIKMEMWGTVSGISITALALILGTVLLVKGIPLAGYITLLGTLGFQGYNYYRQLNKNEEDKSSG